MYCVDIYINGDYFETRVADEKHKLLPVMQETLIQNEDFLDRLDEENSLEKLEKVWMDVEALEKFMFMSDDVAFEVYENALEEREPFTFEAFKKVFAGEDAGEDET